jgi:hypothetical protein
MQAEQAMVPATPPQTNSNNNVQASSQIRNTSWSVVSVLSIHTQKYTGITITPIQSVQDSKNLRAQSAQISGYLNEDSDGEEQTSAGTEGSRRAGETRRNSCRRKHHTPTDAKTGV